MSSMFAERLVFEAGRIAAGYHRGDFEVHEKPDGSPVTSADLAVSDYVLEKIRWHFPEDCLASEEAMPSTAEMRNARRVWLIDPIDGTTYFAQGMKEYGILVGLWEDGQMIGGAANFPEFGLVGAAERGLGTYVNGERVKVSDRVGSNSSVWCWGSQYQSLNTVDAPMILPSMAMLEVATGKYDGLILDTEAGWGEYDIAWAVAIIEEAGGKITDGDGNPLRFNVNGGGVPPRVVCSNGKTHRSLLGWV